MPATSGSPTQIATSQPTKAALSNTPADQFQSGDLGYVQEELVAGRCPVFVLVSAGGPTVDGTMVLSVYQNTAARWVNLAVLGAGTISVANVAELKALPNGSFKEGTWVYVRTLRTFWAYASGLGGTSDDITLATAQTGGNARWTRQDVADPYWGYALTWYVDPVAGNDENVGNASNAALKTVAEFGRRLVHTQGGVVYTVNILGDIPATDVYVDRRMQWNGNVSAAVVSSCVLFTGQQTVVASGTTAAGTTQTAPASAAATAQAELNDAAMNFTPHIGRMAVAANGDTAHILTDKGGGVGVACRVTDWITSAFTLSAGPGAGAAYSVVTLTKWRAQVVLSTNSGPSSGVSQTFSVAFQNLELDDLGNTARSLIGAGSFVAYKRCKLSNSNGGNLNISLMPPGSTVSLFLQASLAWNNNSDIRFLSVAGGGNGNYARAFFANGCGMRRCKMDVEAAGTIAISGLCVQAGWLSGSSTYTTRSTAGSLCINSGNGSWLGVYNDFDLPGSSGIIAAIYISQGASFVQLGSFYGVGSPTEAVSGMRSSNGGRLFIRSTINSPGTATTAYNYVPGAGGGTEMSLDGLAATILPITSAAAGAVLPAAGDPRTFANYIALFNRNMTNYETLGGFYTI